MDKNKMNIEQVSINLLKPYINNPRNNARAIKYLEKAIPEYGFTVPITVDEDYVIVTGHSRYLAAKNLGKAEVPIVVLSHLSDAKIKQFRIADNKVHEHTNFEFSAKDIERLSTLSEDDDFFKDVFSEFVDFDEGYDPDDEDEPEDEDYDDPDEDDEEDNDDEKDCICPYCLHEFYLDESLETD